MNAQDLIKKSGPTLMGILNLTPDSFSDGGQFTQIDQAIKRVKEMEKAGAHIIDIGGESSGPGSKDVNFQEEKSRVIPILKEVQKITNLPISIDTYKSEIANIALQEGANIINDITALRGDSQMAKIIAKHQATVILMYSKDNSPRGALEKGVIHMETTIKKKKYQDIIKNLKEFLKKQINYAQKHGIKKENIIIDPGMGHFVSSIPKYSYEIIARLQELKDLNHPILIGISRKSLLGGPMQARDDRGLPLSAIAYLNGASIIRTHNIRGTKEFFDKLNS